MSSSKIILYGIEPSPPVRAVLLTLSALKLDYEFSVVDLSRGAHLRPEYTQRNPQHTVPMLEDDDKFIWDSHAICAYLVRKYAKNDSLYPRDYYKRAIVDQRLHFDTGVLSYTCLKQITRPLFERNVTEIPKEKIEQIYQAYEMLEKFLGDEPYIAGDKLTIADFSIVATVSSLSMAFAKVDAVRHPKLHAWLARMAGLPYYTEANFNGAKAFSERIRSQLPKHFDKLWHKAFADIVCGSVKEE